MQTITNTYTTDGARAVIESLRDVAIRASIQELRDRDRLTLALRSSLKNGIPIGDLSEASGLTCDEIRRRIATDLHLAEDMDSLVGIA